jgi:endonuclease/exonuclease/phosphatase family metal-dependent hydrolase
MKFATALLCLLVGTSPAISDEFRIATFNIQVFGTTKAGKPDVMAVLAEIVRQYDIVAVQEIKDARNKVPGQFLKAINADGSAYDMRVSDRTGQQPNDRSSREQYAYYFDTETVTSDGPGVLFDDSAEDLFQREPYLARFIAKGGNFSFVLASIHTKPDRAVTEIAALVYVVSWARDQWPEEDDVIVLGDFNAGCDYAAPHVLDSLELAGPDYIWIVPHDADTNLAGRACAYDRIVTTTGTADDFADNWDVDRAFTDKRVSDHWPVWAEFHIDQDGLP